MSKRILYKLVQPQSDSVESRRQEFILNTLLLVVTALSVASFIRVYLNSLMVHPYPGIPPVIMLVITLIFLGLYITSRLRAARFSSYVLVGIIGAAGLYTLYRWGIDLPTGLLALVLGIIMSGILVSTRFSLSYAMLVTSGLLILGYCETNHLTHPSEYWKFEAGGTGDALTFTLILFIITIVIWLSNRELENSLHRALVSEQALQKERDNLERRVIERTKELEDAQREKIMQLYRFADFGRISAGLLHDIINPLTAVSLNLEQLSTRKRSDLVSQAIEGIKYVENFVQAARKQIQNPGEMANFEVQAEVQEVVKALSSKLRAAEVEVNVDVPADLRIHGSRLKFHQLVTNLVSNAIDAYAGSKKATRRVDITLKAGTRANVLTVRDYAKGIAEQDIERIFEPFYTTKPAEKGTGIGLFIARRIMEEDFSGTVTARNAKPAGAAFDLSFPQSA